MVSDLDVLYVDDDPRQIHLVGEAFAECAIPSRVHGVGCGSAALSFLAREGEYADAPRPDIVLLDEDLGGESGLDILAELRARATPPPPVVMFTGSDDPAHVDLAYERGANAFVRKPGDFDGLVSFAEGAVTLWGAPPTVRSSA